MRTILTLTAISAILTLNEAAAQVHFNGGFEYNTDEYLLNQPWYGLTGSHAAYRIFTDPKDRLEGASSLHIQPTTSASGNSSSLIWQQMRLGFLPAVREARVTYSVKFLTGDSSCFRPYTRFFDARNKSIACKARVAISALPNGWWKITETRTVTGNSFEGGWLYFGWVLTGPNEILVDNIGVTIDGNPIADASPAPRPLPTAGAIDSLGRMVRPLAWEGNHNIDFQFLQNELKECRVIGLGEATHGTAEFQLLKTAIIRSLVTSGTINTIVLENDVMATFRGEELLAAGVTPERVLDSALLFLKLYQTEEFTGLLRFVQQHNIAHPGKKVSLWGCDVQFPGYTADQLAIMLQNERPELVPAVQAIGALVRQKKLSALQLDSVSMLVNALERAWNEKPHTGSKMPVLIRQLGMGAAYQKAKLTGGLSPTAVRDSLMAENIRLILSSDPQCRIAVSAHNFHVGNLANPEKSMGHFLSAMPETRYRAYGMLTAGGTANTDFPLKAGVLAEPGKNAYEYYLLQVPHPVFYWPVRSKPMPSFTTLSDKLRSLSMGHTFLQYPYVQFPIQTAYDGIFFFRQTHATNFR